MWDYLTGRSPTLPRLAHPHRGALRRFSPVCISIRMLYLRSRIRKRQIQKEPFERDAETAPKGAETVLDIPLGVRGMGRRF